MNIVVIIYEVFKIIKLIIKFLKLYNLDLIKIKIIELHKYI